MVYNDFFVFIIRDGEMGNDGLGLEVWPVMHAYAGGEEEEKRGKRRVWVVVTLGITVYSTSVLWL